MAARVTTSGKSLRLLPATHGSLQEQQRRHEADQKEQWDQDLEAERMRIKQENIRKEQEESGAREQRVKDHFGHPLPEEDSLERHRKQVRDLRDENEDGSRDWSRIPMPAWMKNSQEQVMGALSSEICAKGQWLAYEKKVTRQFQRPKCPAQDRPRVEKTNPIHSAQALGLKDAILGIWAPKKPEAKTGKDTTKNPLPAGWQSPTNGAEAMVTQPSQPIPGQSAPQNHIQLREEDCVIKSCDGPVHARYGPQLSGESNQAQQEPTNRDGKTSASCLPEDAYPRSQTPKPQDRPQSLLGGFIPPCLKRKGDNQVPLEFPLQHQEKREKKTTEKQKKRKERKKTEEKKTTTSKDTTTNFSHHIPTAQPPLMSLTASCPPPNSSTALPMTGPSSSIPPYPDASLSFPPSLGSLYPLPWPPGPPSLIYANQALRYPDPPHLPLQYSNPQPLRAPYPNPPPMPPLHPNPSPTPLPRSSTFPTIDTVLKSAQHDTHISTQPKRRGQGRPKKSEGHTAPKPVDKVAAALEPVDSVEAAQVAAVSRSQEARNDISEPTNKLYKASPQTLLKSYKAHKAQKAAAAAAPKPPSQGSAEMLLKTPELQTKPVGRQKTQGKKREAQKAAKAAAASVPIRPLQLNTTAPKTVEPQTLPLMTPPRSATKRPAGGETHPASGCTIEPQTQPFTPPTSARKRAAGPTNHPIPRDITSHRHKAIEEEDEDFDCWK